tara:strand:+ start:68 stop:319 length:252 start_codon:yes stop_codon:yes gene_type:complete
MKMSKKPRYRIKEYNLPFNRTQWVVQRRSIFGFWYNPNNIDGMIDGWYDSLEEADKILEAELHKTTSKVVKEVYTKPKQRWGN